MRPPDTLSLLLCLGIAGVWRSCALAGDPDDSLPPREKTGPSISRLSDATRFLRDRGAVTLLVDWNPKAPAAMQARYEYDLILSDGRLVALHRTPELDCAITYDQANVRLVDNNSRACVDLDTIEFANLGAATGTLAEIHAGRLLLGYTGYLYLSEQLGGEKMRRFDLSRTKAALRRLYCDEASNAVNVGTTEIRQITESNRESLEWRDEGGVIFYARVSSADAMSLQERLRSFQWVDSRTRLKRPTLVDLLTFIKAYSIDMAPGSQIVLQTPKGPVVGGKVPDRPHGFSEACHVQYRNTRLFVHVGDAWGTVGAPRRAFAKEKGVIITKYFDDAGGVFGASVNLEAQDWAIGYVMPGGPRNLEYEQAVTPIFVKYLVNRFGVHEAANQGEDPIFDEADKPRR